jgi:mRNA-degrading endonuclease RelE of RelBE toxin-antitoxin system
MRYKIFFKDQFRKELKRLSIQDKKLVFAKIKVIRNNPRYQSKRVKGIKRNIQRTRVNRDIRLFWEYDPSNDIVIIMLRIGHHDVEKMRKVQSY